MPTTEDQKLLTLADIGRRLGVTRQRAQQIALRPSAKFPAPVYYANGPLYSDEDVETWIRLHRPELLEAS